jgi:hypothetical protein
MGLQSLWSGAKQSCTVASESIPQVFGQILTEDTIRAGNSGPRCHVIKGMGMVMSITRAGITTVAFLRVAVRDLSISLPPAKASHPT